MIEAIGDMWLMEADAHVITTNGFVKRDGTNVMGAGTAKQAAERWPDLPRILGELLLSYGNYPFVIPEQHMPLIFTMPVKHVWWQQADLKLIRRSAYGLVVLATAFQCKSVVVPRPGCGNGGLSWDKVKPVVEEYWDDRFTVVTI